MQVSHCLTYEAIYDEVDNVPNFEMGIQELKFLALLWMEFFFLFLILLLVLPYQAFLIVSYDAIETCLIAHSGANAFSWI